MPALINTQPFPFESWIDMKKLSFIVAFMVSAVFSPAYADCLSPSGVAGTQMYNATHSVMHYCNGTSWISMDGSYTGNVGPEADNLGAASASQNLNMGGFQVNDLAAPTAGTDAATKVYVDTKTGGGEIDPQAGTLTNNKLCKANGTTINCTFNPPTTQPLAMFFATDDKGDGTDGGASGGTSWSTRTINTVKKNDIGASLAGNQITLPPGVYYVDAVVPFMRTAQFKTRLYNVTAGTSAITGTAGQAATPTTEGNASTTSFIRGVVGITATSTFRIEYFTENSSGAFSQGYPMMGSTTEVYAYIAITRIASAATVAPAMPACAGTLVGAQCWYLGSTNQSCDTVCGSHGGCQDGPMIDYAGNSGTNANCETVLTALGSAGSVSDSTSTTNNYERLGCNIRSGTRYRFTAATTTCGDAYSTSQRACSCMN
jgi:hypothetical protein